MVGGSFAWYLRTSKLGRFAHYSGCDLLLLSVISCFQILISCFQILIAKCHFFGGAGFPLSHPFLFLLSHFLILRFPLKHFFLFFLLELQLRREAPSCTGMVGVGVRPRGGEGLSLKLPPCDEFYVLC